MRILHLISSEGFYGAENVVANLTLESQRAGHWVRVGVFENQHLPNGVADQFEARGVGIIRIPCRGRMDWAVMGRIREIVARENIEIVHSHGYKADIYVCLACRSLELPLVSTSHLWTRQTRAIRFYEFLDAIALRRFQAVVAVSETVAEDLYRAGIQKQRVTVIDNGIDMAQFVSALPVLDSELDKEGGLLIGTVGRLVGQKGLTYFLRAARELLQGFPNLKFVLVGDGPDRDSLQQLARDLGIESRVFFTGARKDVARIYASLDVFVLASVDEGLPMVLLEALASGCPTTATRVGAVPRVIINEETGLLVQPADVGQLVQALRRLVSDPELRNRLGHAGKQFIHERFSSQVMADRYITLYRKMIAHGALSLNSVPAVGSGV